MGLEWWMEMGHVARTYLMNSKGREGGGIRLVLLIWWSDNECDGSVALAAGGATTDQNRQIKWEGM